MMKIYLSAAALLALAPSAAVAGDAAETRFEHGGATYRYTVTEVGDAHDRYANSQTNFLLQRIEDYEGVAILATNSRDRFDPAFVRRFDTVLEFPLPDAPARRLLWDCHLGESHAVSEARLDRLAAAVDLTGGHVRNVVLAAAARARSEERRVESRDLDAAIAEEYAKLGRTAPSLAGS